MARPATAAGPGRLRSEPAAKAASSQGLEEFTRTDHGWYTCG
ncbi:MAG TPA: hypothetical protein VGM12_10490 [Trebonia sp.]